MFTTLGFPRFRASYFHRNQDGAALFKYRVGMFGVVEFNDTAPEGFDTGDLGSIVRTVNFVGKGTNWSPIAITSSPGGSVVNTRTGETFFPASATGPTDERITLSLTVADGYFRDVVQNRTLLPNGPKWDITIENIRYTHPNTKIAILLAVESFAGRGKMDDSDAPVDTTLPEGSITVGNGGRFNWVKTVKAKFVDSFKNRNANLITSTLFSNTNTFNMSNNEDQGDSADFDATETRSFIAFTPEGTDQPTTIIWDPSVLIDDDAFNGALKTGVPVLEIFSLVAIIVSLF
jgi:hypothetical protein